jgi:hypothetical protein
MDNTIAIAIITGLFGIVSGVILAYLGAILKFQKDLEAEYDKDLRNRRIEVYKELWKHLQLLARYDRPKPLTPKNLEELSVEMRRWYFEIGGLYLSEETRKTYFDLKQAIQRLTETAKYSADEVLDQPDSKFILQKASLLRASLTHDVGTRKSSPIADS